jgi:hypothetical protein
MEFKPGDLISVAVFVEDKDGRIVEGKYGQIRPLELL